MPTPIGGPAAVIAELRKATPPTRKELIKGTLHVLALVAVMVLVIGAADAFLGALNSHFFVTGER